MIELPPDLLLIRATGEAQEALRSDDFTLARTILLLAISEINKMDVEDFEKVAYTDQLKKQVLQINNMIDECYILDIKRRAGIIIDAKI